MQSSSVYLFTCSVLAPLRRVRGDLGKELTVLGCALFVAATFVYIFHDFINNAVASISMPMRDSFARSAAVLCTTIVAFSLGKFLRRASVDNYCRLQQHLGVERQQLRLFLVLRGAWAVLLSAVIIVLCGKLLRVSLLLPSVLAWPPSLLLGIFLAHRSPPAFTSHAAVRRHTLFSWRWQQILRGERLLLGIAAAAALSCYPLSHLGAPLPVFGCAALVCGLAASFSIATQAARDAQFAWAEKNFGISHTQYVRTCEKIGALLALCCALSCALCFVTGQLLLATPMLPWFSALKVALLAALAPLLMPSLLFQIDVRRAVVQFITATLATLFIGTAILASWFALLLYPLWRWYALQYSDGRFYRA